MRTSKLGEFSLSFDYSQLLVYDVSVEVPECLWTEAHCAQGFARRESVACVGMILQYGNADVTAFFGPYSRQEFYQRVISMPFDSPSGKIVVRGLMEIHLAHLMFSDRGHYTLYVAQWVIDEDQSREGVHLFFHPQEGPTSNSEIILADDALNPPPILLEGSEELTS